MCRFGVLQTVRVQSANLGNRRIYARNSCKVEDFFRKVCIIIIIINREQTIRARTDRIRFEYSYIHTADTDTDTDTSTPCWCLSHLYY